MIITDFKQHKNKVKYGSVENLNFHNSIIYLNESTYKIRSAFSEFRFRYRGTYLGLRINPTAYSIYPQFSQITLIINDEVYNTYTVTSTSYMSIQLPSGNKTIRIIEGLTSKPSSTIIGTFITQIRVDLNKFHHLPIVPISEKLVFLGDSITVGANANVPATKGYARLFDIVNHKEIAILGYGYGKLKDFAENSTKINTTVAQIQSMFANVNTTKKLCIALGTNDFALDSIAAATFQAWYENLLDAIHSTDSTILIWCLSPIIRSSDGALLDDYRTAIGTICAARSSYCIHIPGKSILTTDNLSDGVHPTTNGHLLLYNGIYDYLL